MGRTESCRLGGGFQYEKPRKASTAVLLDGVAEIVKIKQRGVYENKQCVS